jgi:hypothetical protein
MPMTHEQARRFIELNMDKALSLQEKAVLSIHLQDCADCRKYASEIHEVESLLFPLMKKQWHLEPPPLPFRSLRGAKSSMIGISMALTTRISILSVVTAALFFSLWQFTLSATPDSGQLPIAVPLVPTPSTQPTITKIKVNDCELTIHIVQQNEALADIADRFSIPEEEIIKLNDLETGTIRPKMEIMIPVCTSTPTVTVNPATYTTTYTPRILPNTSTPGG